jgi:WXG100 family type VII secretion target
MAKVEVDPEKLRSFAKDLTHLSREMDKEMKKVRGRFKQLHDSWRDQEYKKFSSSFERSLKEMTRFKEQAESYSKHLHRKAKQIEPYLGKS